MNGPALLLTLDQLLPRDPDDPEDAQAVKAAKNSCGLRLFAVACADRVLSLLTDPYVRQAIEAARQYALGAISWERLEFAYTMADSVKVPESKRYPHHWATIAATATASTECQAGPRNRGTSEEWAAIAAARIASCAASLAEQSAWFRTPEQVEEQQIEILRRYVPECFKEE